MQSLLFCDKSQWIWLNSAPTENCYLQFRQRFVPTTGEAVTLHITAEGPFAVYLNGSYLPATQYPDYPHHKAVSQIVLSDCVAQQENLLEIQVHHPNVDTAVCHQEKPGLRFELHQGQNLLACSNAQTPVRLLPGYHSGPISKITVQLGFGFDWSEPTHDELWDTADVVCKDCTFVPRPIPQLTVSPRCPSRLMAQGVFTSYTYPTQQNASIAFRELETMTATPNAPALYLQCPDGDGLYLLYDLGKETVGYLELEIACPSTTTIDVGFGEHLEDLRVRTNVGGRQFVLRYQSCASTPVFTHRFLRLGCRYLQLFIHGHEATVHYAGLLPVHYPFQQEGHFQCSDHLHQRIYETAKYTLDCCLHEHYEDCPWREQGLYTFDSRNQILCGYYAYGEFTQPRESLRLMAKSQRPDGLLELCTPGRIDVDIPSFSLAFILELEEYCRYSGDVAFANEMMPVVRRILEAFHHKFADGLMWNFREPGYWNFYEWRPMLEAIPNDFTQPLPPSAEAPLQLYYLLALQRTAAICRYLKMEESAALSDEICAAQAGLEQFWDPDAQLYASFIRDGKRIQFAELTQALALYANVVPQARQDALREKLASGTLVPISVSSSIFKYDALLQDPHRYGEAVFEEVANHWGNMLYQGATTFWETELGDADFDRAGSLCHGWSAVPLYLYGAYLLGVRPEEPGVWKQFEPVRTSVLYAKATLHSPAGVMDVKVVHPIAD